MPVPSFGLPPLPRLLRHRWVIAAHLAAGLAYVWLARSPSPDQVARRLCTRRYAQSHTAADTAGIDSLRTMTRDGVAPHTCGELRQQGRA